MIVYIQKKVDGVWCTLLTLDWSAAQQPYKHLCKQYPQCEFRINREETVPFKSKGLSLCSALHILCDMELAGLGSEQANGTFSRIADILFKMYDRYKH